MHLGKEFIQGLAIIFTAFNFHVNLFPIHSNQKDKSITATVKIISTSLSLVLAIYLCLAVIGLLMYGSNISQSILDNIGKKYSGSEVFWEAHFMQALFLVIIACHIPYLFFSGKESLLIIVDELMRRSVSHTLSRKLLAQDPNTSGLIHEANSRSMQ